MAVRYIPPKLEIAITKSTINPKFYIDQYFKGVDNIVKKFGARAGRAIILIAPFNYGDRGLNSPAGYDYRGKTIKQSIETEYDENGFFVNVDNDSPKAIVQEFGYKEENPLWKAPYRPNPKRKKEYAGKPGARIKGVGYLRVGILLAADAMLSDRFNPDKSPPIGRVNDYRKEVKARLQQAVAKFTLAYSKSQKTLVPAYMSKQVVFPREPVISKFASRVGSFSALKIPIKTGIDEISLYSQLPLRVRSFASRITRR